MSIKHLDSDVVIELVVERGYVQAAVALGTNASAVHSFVSKLDLLDAVQIARGRSPHSKCLAAARLLNVCSQTVKNMIADGRLSDPIDIEALRRAVACVALEPYREPLIWGVTPVKCCVGCGSRFNERRGLRGRRIGRGEFCTPECKEAHSWVNEHRVMRARRLVWSATVRVKSSRQKQRKTPLVAGPCCVCGELLIARQLTKHAVHCKGCVTEAQQAVIRACRDRRKARKRGAFKTAPVYRRKVFERDKWKCHICGGRIDKSLTAPDRGSATLDHIVPLAFGGEHTMHNIKAAHYGCNSRRGHHAEFQTVLAVAA